ncbi:MAG: penicillin acylase family protein [Saprospiraceae bacterium]|nr:penicillin acylase family protein [Saprospiraceae bacterium]
MCKFCFVLVFINLNLGLFAQSFNVDVSDSVEILIDHWGVPHIYAKNEADLFFAQGFNAARDRLFQFEIWRRQATGTVAEILGRKELKRDIGTRLFKFRGNIDEELNHYHPKGKIIIESFVAGVNNYIDWILRNPERLPVEFRILKIEPQPWTPEVVISRHQGLLGNIEDELDIGRLVHLIGKEKTKEILWFHPFEPNLKIDKKIDGGHLFNDILELYKAYRKPVKFDLTDIGLIEDRLDVHTDGLGYRRSILADETMGLGSNNWALSGSRTQSGYPILANDPHRTVAVPSLRYMSHLVGPGWNVIGGGEPEIPGISIGHNEYGAWGLTVFATDAEDLYVYRLNPEDANAYWHDDHWVSMQTIEEEIPVKNSDPERAILHYTIHGPVVYVDSVANIAYAVRCGWLEPGGSPYLASLRMNQSIDFESFREACNFSHIPGENMVWADPAGNIGWQAVGIAPIRNHFSGLVPIPGDGSHEWQDYLEIKKKPNSFNPPSDYIITANENLIDLNYPYPEAVGYEWSDPVRGDRIAEYFEQGRKMTMTDMMQLQNDHLSITARTIIPLLNDLRSPDVVVEKARKMLIDWDFILDISSIEATIYYQWERELKDRIKQIKVPEAAIKYIGSLQNKKVVDFLIFPDGDFGNNPIQARDQVLLDCLASAVAKITGKLGSDMNNWKYGQADFKHVMLTHALSEVVDSTTSARLNVGPAPRGGNGTTVGSTSNNLRQSTGATFKIIVDTEDWNHTLAINAPGQSGNPDDRHYRDLFDLWSKDKYFPLYFSRSKVESVLDKKLVLVPK